MYESLSTVLSSDLNFHNEVSTYSSHGIHVFAAKFPPQLPRIFIESFTQPGDIVLDPMNGSGTTLLESYILLRRGMGCDIDPLSIKMTRVKTTPLDVDFNRVIPEIIDNAYCLLKETDKINNMLNYRFDKETKEFIDYWFFPETQMELMALILAIEKYSNNEQIKELLEVIFSGIIITKSGGVSRAIDLAHSRPHFDPEKKPKSAIKAFEQRLLKFTPVISTLPVHRYNPIIWQGNAKNICVDDDSVHLIVTSPPYANAIDYMRANKFSLVWLGEPISKLREIRSTSIGNEATANFKMETLPKYSEDILKTLKSKNVKKEAILRKYYIEMRDAMKEMHRVLISGHYAILVVGTSTMCGIDVKTPQCLANIAEQDIGFSLEAIQSRVLDRNRRMMPFSNGKTSIEQRMLTEEIIILKKK
ncbi:DNA methyltransferase [Methanocella sp. MCL-LM]|uniref:DNA methyltransferase n=1 Tax=Methanocella sp. MCL-LM TaxID=3412035 RepID=UPI003C789386